MHEAHTWLSTLVIVVVKVSIWLFCVATVERKKKGITEAKRLKIHAWTRCPQRKLKEPFQESNINPPK